MTGIDTCFVILRWLPEDGRDMALLFDYMLLNGFGRVEI